MIGQILYLPLYIRNNIGCGCTAAVALIWNERLYIANAGDTRHLSFCYSISFSLTSSF